MVPGHWEERPTTLSEMNGVDCTVPLLSSPWIPTIVLVNGQLREVIAPCGQRWKFEGSNRPMKPNEPSEGNRHERRKQAKLSRLG